VTQPFQKVEKCWKRLEKVENGWGALGGLNLFKRLKRVGKGWKRLEKVGKGWKVGKG
jgi:hypothetical protein